MDVLSRRCCKTLKFLDIESSKAVRDNVIKEGDNKGSNSICCVTSLTRLKNLQEMNLFDTKLSDESLATILLALPNLEHLNRGDFLCDALEWIDYWVSNSNYYQSCLHSNFCFLNSWRQRFLYTSI